MRKRREGPAGRDPREAEEIVQNARRPDGPENINRARLRQRETETRPDGFRSVGDIAAAIIADLSFVHRVRRLHARGPRLIAELLAELGAERSIMTMIEEKLDRFLAISDTDLDLVRGRDLPPLPLHAVPR